MNWRYPILVAVTATLAGMPAVADTIYLKNSDRITGEIGALEDGWLNVKTKYAGAIRVDWKMVERISTERVMTVQSSSGLRLTGPLAGPANVIAVRGTGATGVVDFPNVVSIQPVVAETRDRIEPKLTAAVDLGFSLTRGNSDLNQSSVGVHSQYRTDSFQLKTDLTSLFSRQAEVQSAGSHSGAVRLDRFLSPRSFAFILGSLERDDRELLNLRTVTGGGMGWRLTNSEGAELSLLAGSTFLNEHFRTSETNDRPPRKSSGEALLTVNLEKFAIGGARFCSKLSLQPNLLQAGRYRLGFDSGVRVPLVGRLTWGVDIFERFDSRPPSKVERNDFGVLSSVGIAF
jgi:hypothetical protein